MRTQAKSYNFMLTVSKKYLIKPLLKKFACFHSFTCTKTRNYQVFTIH